MSCALISVFLFFERLITHFLVFNSTNFGSVSSVLPFRLCTNRTLPLEPHLRVQQSTRSFLVGLPTINSLRNIPYRLVTWFASFHCEYSFDLLYILRL